MSEEMLDSDKMRPLAMMAVEDLEDMYRNNYEPSSRNKASVCLLGIYVRQKNTEINADLLKYQAAKDMSKDKKELARYIEVSMPRYNVVKRLGK